MSLLKQINGNAFMRVSIIHRTEKLLLIPEGALKCLRPLGSEL